MELILDDRDINAALVVVEYWIEQGNNEVTE